MTAVAIEHLGLNAFDRILRLTSFGFRYGIPPGCKNDILVDLRSRPIKRLMYPSLTTESGSDRLEVLIQRTMNSMSSFETELRVNIGCETGKKESVNVVHWLASKHWNHEWFAQVHHRDLFNDTGI